MSAATSFYAAFRPLFRQIGRWCTGIPFDHSIGFDKDNWPNMADSTWGTNIYKHYGYTALLGRSVRQDEHRDENRRRHCLRLVVAEGG